MASPLQSEDVVPTFLPFFGMTRAPFCRLSAPTEIFHSDQSGLLNSHLTAATKRPDSLVVILGADGIGKTTLLNQYIAGLDDEPCYAVFDETCMEGIQFYRSILEQIGLGEIVGTLHELQHITSEYLVHRARNGEHALIFVDNAHLVRPAVLEQLRWLADIDADHVRPFSMVVAGNPSFQRIMDSPAMRSLTFRHQTNFHIRAYSEIETDDYIRHRLNLAGAADAAKFSEESRALIYRFTGGNPYMINTLCNAVFAESCAEGSRVITEQRIRAVAEARKLLPHVIPKRGKARRKSDSVPPLFVPDANSSERITGRQADPSLAAGDAARISLLHDLEIKELLVRIAELSSQSDRKSNEEKRLALLEVRKHDKDTGELRAQLAAQVDLAARLFRTLDDKTKDIDRVNEALSESERLRQDARKARQSMADALDASKVALAERDNVIADLRAQLETQATELNGLLTTVASSAAEILTLKQALSDSSQAALQSGKASQDSIAERKKQRRLTRRAKARHGNAREQPENPSKPADEKVQVAEKPLADHDACTTGTSETKSLLPDQMMSVPASECTTVTPPGNATAIELFLDGKPLKVIDLAGRPARMMVGRAEDCDLRLDSRYVSRHHAMIVNSGDHVSIEDLRSSNGIFVNSLKVDLASLRPGDTVAIGNFKLRLKCS